MRNNYLYKLIAQLKTVFIIFFRKTYFFLNKKKAVHKGFIAVKRDSTFSNSLIKVTFNFDTLVYIFFPGVGKKLYNGSIYISSEAIKYPYTIKIYTADGLKTHVIESLESSYRFESEKFNNLQLIDSSGYQRHPSNIKLPVFITKKNWVNRCNTSVALKPPKVGISKVFKLYPIKHRTFLKTDFYEK